MYTFWTTSIWKLWIGPYD